MMPGDVAPLILGVTFMLLVAMTVLLYPLSRKLASLVEVIIQEKSRIPPPTNSRMEEVLARMDARLARLEEAQSFMSALQSPGAERLAVPASHRASPERESGN